MSVPTLGSADAEAVHGETNEPVPAGSGHDHGAPHHGGHDGHFGHESPPIMWVPLMVLAACTVLVGILFGPTHIFERHLMRTPGFEDTLPHVEHVAGWGPILAGTLAAVIGLGISWLMYASPSPIPGRLAKAMGAAYRASLAKFYVDEFYEVTVVRPVRVLAIICKFVDVYIVDGLVRLVAWIPRFVGRDLLGPFQNGLTQSYAAATALGVVGLLILLLLTIPG